MKARLVWRKRPYEAEERGMTGLQALHILFIFPFSQQNRWELVKYWLLGLDASELPSLALSGSLWFSPACSDCLAYAQSKCAKQRKQSVTEHFSILLMLQLSPCWFDNINCCPQCYWWADPSQSRSAALGPSMDQASGRAGTLRTCSDPVGRGLVSIYSCKGGTEAKLFQMH